MGWSRWAHTIRVFTLNSGLFYIRPNQRTIALMDRITARLMKEKAWDQAVFNEEIWFPSHGDFKGSHIRWERLADVWTPYGEARSMLVWCMWQHQRQLA
jgi:hypothetical protein